MNPSPNREVALFSAALELPASQRSAYLEQACADDPALRLRLEALLRVHEEAIPFLENPAPGAQESPMGAELPDATVRITLAPSEKAGGRIGRYKLLQQIGEGGCGVVYMAEQEEPVRRRVALKVIKLGMDTRQVIARFEAERQALALMDHPNISKVLEAGATEAGRPYFVMELVRGIKITDYCDQNNLSTEERVKLFMQVCQAIQHAHQKGIIHRDIKPSNILVADHDGVPVPKIIDFGIAKATTDQRLTDKTLFTAFEQFIGTPAYMSPEQAKLSGLDVDTRSDIYSLGVLLYELLTGSTPFDSKALMYAGLDEIRRTILEMEPPKPSTRLSTMTVADLSEVAKQRHAESAKLGSLIRGDLDWIVMKALEKDRARRYETANGLARDLQRHLNIEPVQARPPSRLYEFQKTVRRHKLGFIAAAAVVTTLAIGVVVSSSEALRATRAEHRARIAQTDEATARRRAQQNAAESRSRLVRQYVANGNRLVAEGDLLGAIPWFAQALKEEQDEPERAKIHRLRLLTTLQQCPKLVQMWFHRSMVNDATFSPDGRWVATASDDRRVQVWDAASGQQVSAPLEHPGPVRFVAFSPRGDRIAAACENGATGVWDVRQGRLLFPYLQHTAGPIQFSPDDRRLLTCGGSAQLWDAATGARIGPAMKHDRDVAWATFSPRGTRVITASEDRTGRIWDAATGQPTAPPLKHEEGVTSAELSPDETLAATSSWDGTARLWDAGTGQKLHVLHHGGPVWRVAFNPDGRRLITASEDGTAVVWDTLTGGPVAPPLKHTGPVADARFSPDGHLVITCSTDGTARAWDAATGKPISPPLRHWAGLAPISRLGLMRVSFHPDGHRILTVSLDHSARVWDLAGGEPVFFGVKHPTVAVGACFSEDASQISSVSLDGTVYVWEAASARLLRTAITNLEPPEPRGFTRDGQAIVQSTTNGLTVALDFESSRAVPLELPPPGRLNHAELDRDGRRMVTANSDHTARVWDARTGKPVSPPMPHKSGVNYATFSPDGRLVATASDDETARVWDSSTGEPVTPPLKHSAIVRSVRFGPDSTRLLTTSADGRVQIWMLATEHRPLPDDLFLARLVAAHQIDDTGACVPVTSEVLEAAWRTLRRKRDTAFVVTPEQVRAWERQETETDTDAQAMSQLQTLWGEGLEFMDANKWTEAMEAFSKATDLIAERPQRSVLATTLHDNRATACGHVHHFREAIRDCNEALWRWPGDFWVEGFVATYHKRAGYHLRLGEYEQALTDFQKGLALDSWFTNYRNRGASYYHNLARAYVLGPTDFRSAEKALPLAQKALELGSNPNYSNTLGVVYYRLGQFQMAIDMLEANAKAEGGLVTAWDWLCLAMSFQRLGQTAKAEAYYAKAAAWAVRNEPTLRPLDREDLENFRMEACVVLDKRKEE